MTSVIPAARTKFQTACESIYRLALEAGPGAKLPTVVQLCASLEVTVVTLNTVLDEMERRGVLYRRRGSGIFVSPQFNQKSVVLLCHPSFFQTGTSPFWTMLVERITHQAEAHRESFSLHFASKGIDEVPIHESLLQQIRDGRVHGILGVGVTNAQTEWIESLGIPYVGYAGPGKYHVEQDQEELIRLGVGELISRGCKFIGLWSFVPPYRLRDDVDFLLQWERDAVNRVWKEFDLSLEPALIRDNAQWMSVDKEFVTTSGHEQGFRTAYEIFTAEEQKPDGVVITSDVVARGALVALQKLGIEPGKRLMIATHTNVDSSILLGFEENLIVIEYDPNEVVSSMFDMLETLMRGEIPEHNIAVVKPRLVRRRPISTSCHPAEIDFIGEREVLK